MRQTMRPASPEVPLHYAAVDPQGSSSCSGSLQRANKDNHVGDFFDRRQAADQ
jgi:hypothetical protein